MNDDKINITLTQESLGVEVEQRTIIDDLEVELRIGGGITQVYHTDDLSGKGTNDNPLGLSDDFKNVVDGKQDQLTPGPGIAIDENNVISVTNSFIYQQTIPSSEWIITHNLGRNPTVVVVDTAGNVVFPAVRYDSLNTCTVITKNAFKGTAYLN